MEKTQEYKVVKLEDNGHYVIFDPYDIEVIDCGEFTNLHSQHLVDLLNEHRLIVCWSYLDEKEGTAILSEMIVNGYHLLSHAAAEYDGQVINSVILKKDR